jgi:hypothetical protein
MQNFEGRHATSSFVTSAFDILHSIPFFALLSDPCPSPGAPGWFSPFLSVDGRPGWIASARLSKTENACTTEVECGEESQSRPTHFSVISVPSVANLFKRRRTSLDNEAPGGDRQWASFAARMLPKKPHQRKLATEGTEDTENPARPAACDQSTLPAAPRKDSTRLNTRKQQTKRRSHGFHG